MQFHSRGYYINNFNKKDTIEILPKKENMVDLKKYLLQYSSDQIKELDIRDVFDVDIDYINVTQSKIKELLDASSSLI